jgi:hypothetical protein
MSLTKGTSNRLDLLLATLQERLARTPVQVVLIVVVPCSPDISPATQEPTPAPALWMILNVSHRNVS